MLSFPFEIPPSLYSYLEKFEDDPKGITKKLEDHLDRRGQDPIGEFLLAWFYLHQDKKEAALVHGIKAKAYAPGSPLMEHLPYFIRHPETFNAWQPTSQSSDHQVTESVFAHPRYPNSLDDLDELIEQISQVNPKKLRKRQQKEFEEPEEHSHGVEADEVDDIISETLADIYEKQNRFERAIHVYQQLMQIYPDHEEVYRNAIDRLQKRIDEEKGNEDD